MKTPMFKMTPDFSPVVKMMAFQTQFAIEASQGMMKLAMLPWQGLPMSGFGNLCVPGGSVKVKAEAPKAEVKTEEKKTKVKAATPKVEAAVETPVADVKVETPKVETKVETPAVEEAPAAPEVEVAVEAPVVEAEVKEEVAAEVEAPSDAVMPEVLSAPMGEADDLTILTGVGPKMAESLNKAGIYHFSQVAKWTEAEIAWIDENVTGAKGKAVKNDWVAQAAELTK
jgi:predicted flap endonuclease-1-like 5' DNA nuclease